MATAEIKYHLPCGVACNWNAGGLSELKQPVDQLRALPPGVAWVAQDSGHGLGGPTAPRAVGVAFGVVLGRAWGASLVVDLDQVLDAASGQAFGEQPPHGRRGPTARMTRSCPAAAAPQLVQLLQSLVRPSRRFPRDGRAVFPCADIARYGVPDRPDDDVDQVDYLHRRNGTTHGALSRRHRVLGRQASLMSPPTGHPRLRSWHHRAPTRRGLRGECAPPQADTKRRRRRQRPDLGKCGRSKMRTALRRRARVDARRHDVLSEAAVRVTVVDWPMWGGVLVEVWCDLRSWSEEVVRAR